jgi:hypothetical protein
MNMINVYTMEVQNKQQPEIQDWLMNPLADELWKLRQELAYSSKEPINPESIIRRLDRIIEGIKAKAKSIAKSTPNDQENAQN